MLSTKDVLDAGDNRENQVTTYQTRSVGGGGIFTVNLPIKLFSSTFSIRGVLDTPFIARFTYLFSVACWKYLFWVNLSTNRSSFFPALPPLALKKRMMQSVSELHTEQNCLNISNFVRWPLFHISAMVKTTLTCLEQKSKICGHLWNKEPPPPPQ